MRLFVPRGCSIAVLAPLFVASCIDFATPTFTPQGADDPQVSGTLPEDGATLVQPSSIISVTFNTTMESAVVKLSPELPLTAAMWNTAKTTALFQPTTTFAASTLYTMTITGQSATGAALAETTRTFTTASVSTGPGPTGPTMPTGPSGPPAPLVLSTAPTDGATLVNGTTPMQITFSRAMNATSTSVDCTPTVSFSSKSFDGTLQVLELSAAGGAFADSTSYTCLISGLSQEGVALSGNKSLQFTTTDVRAPTVLFTDPPNGATAVINQQPTTIAIKFSEAMDPASTLSATMMTGVPGATGTWSEGNTRLTMAYEDVVGGGDTIGVTVSTSARDAFGNALGSALTSTHTRAHTGSLSVTSLAAMDSHVSRTDPSTYALGGVSATSGLVGVTGPSPSRQHHKSLVSFDLSGLPANLVHISGVTLSVCMIGKVGTPTGILQAEAITYASLSDAALLYNSANDGLSAFSNGWASAPTGNLNSDVTTAVRDDWTNRGANGNLSQFLIRFANDEIMTGGSIKLQTGDSSAAGTPCAVYGHKPRLDISYQYP